MSKNPCIDICQFADAICLGCGRSKREIKAWKKLAKVERRMVLAEAGRRLLALQAAGRCKSREAVYSLPVRPAGYPRMMRDPFGGAHCFVRLPSSALHTPGGA